MLVAYLLEVATFLSLEVTEKMSDSPDSSRTPSHTPVPHRVFNFSLPLLFGLRYHTHSANSTTGLLNSLDDIGALCKKYEIELIVDAMSSYAAIPIDMKKQNISYLAASSNKNIQGMAGVGFIIAKKSLLESLKDIKPRGFYLSLYEQYKNFIKTKQMRFTPPVQALYALKQAVIEAKKEGIGNRYLRYSKSWKLLTSTLKELGINYLVEDKYHSKIITSIHIPDGVDFNEMHDYFYEKGITIYPGKVSEFNTFRIANIGQIDNTDIEMFLKLFKKYLKNKFE